MVHASEEDRQAIREAIRKICAGFPDAYWRDIDKAGAAIFFGYKRGEIAARRQRVDEGLRIGGCLVDVAPIGIREAGADLADRFPYRLAVFLARVHHLSLSQRRR